MRCTLDEQGLQGAGQGSSEWLQISFQRQNRKIENYKPATARSRCPVSTPNGRATVLHKCSVSSDQCSNLCVLCVRVYAEPQLIQEVHRDEPASSFVCRGNNRFCEPLDLVLVSGTAEANDKATKVAFLKIRSVCLLSGVKAEQPRKRALSGQCHNCQLRARVRHCFNPARCIKCLGDHGTAQCTRNKNTDGPPACVLSKQKATRSITWDARVLQKEPPPPEAAAPRRAPARGLVNAKLRPRSGGTTQRSACRETTSNVRRGRFKSTNGNNIKMAVATDDQKLLAMDSVKELKNAVVGPQRQVHNMS
ncbi:hypothetical protein EVAR_65468_1 [Eumeta japonica]|uniref:Nucleic-acid-binding protein from transposon X-element n=1 Tax=Eumeta variegata TaxID=151549 RepID=A0A4C1YV84_EUMVA|nr:hypothetical protein EVAR_65468_1 [Eumeta japonica]